MFKSIVKQRELKRLYTRLCELKKLAERLADATSSHHITPEEKQLARNYLSDMAPEAVELSDKMFHLRLAILFDEVERLKPNPEKTNERTNRKIQNGT